MTLQTHDYQGVSPATTQCEVFTGVLQRQHLHHIVLKPLICALQWVLSTGLGLFEYMELAEELGADAVWVLNNGVAHDESIPTADIQPLIRDTLGSLEFVRGGPESKWGRVRAQLGRQRPWSLKYVAIGNEVRLSMTAVHLGTGKDLLLTHIHARCALDIGEVWQQCVQIPLPDDVLLCHLMALTATSFPNGLTSAMLGVRLTFLRSSQC